VQEEESTKTEKSLILPLALIATLIPVLGTERPLAQEPFYQGKTVRIIVGFAPGGGFDAYARSLARHMGKHIPGNPTLIVENMTGAGSLVAANHLYRAAKPDGLAKATWKKQLETGEATVVLQNAPQPHADFPSSIPLAIKLAKTEDGRQLIHAGIHAPSAFTYPYAAPPGTPKDRIQILRRAFWNTVKDQKFLAEASKANLEVNSIPGEEVEKLIADLFKLQPNIVSRLKELLSQPN